MMGRGMRSPWRHLVLCLCLLALAAGGCDDEASDGQMDGVGTGAGTGGPDEDAEAGGPDQAEPDGQAETVTSSGGDMATETNAVPAVCEDDAGCPDGVACVFTNEGDAFGYCDVAEMDVSLAVPAPCEDDGDCPAGVACVSSDPGGPGHCDISEKEAR